MKGDIVTIDSSDDEREETGEEVIPIECPHCGNHPCVVKELEEMFVSILETYSGWKTNKQIRYKMYGDAIIHIHGHCLGKGNRKKLPACVENTVKKMCPDDNYTGFIPTNNNE